MTEIAPAERRIDRHGDLPVTARNATMDDLVAILREQHSRKVDVVAPATCLSAEGGLLRIAGASPSVDSDGVTEADGLYRPTSQADEGLAYRLGIPSAYLKRCREQRPDLYDANVNGWLHGAVTAGVCRCGRQIAASEARAGFRSCEACDEPAPDPRSFLVRAFRSETGVGLARAVLSDRYRIVDNLDVLTAALDGVRQSGVNVEVEGADLSDRRMRLRVTCPDVAAHAPELLADYRSPFTGARGADNPTVWAGFVISNSETGGGAFTITPRLVVEVCRNGMTITRDAMREVHVGGRLEDGVVRWSDDTQRRSLELVTAQARDAAATFVDQTYLGDTVDRLAEEAGRPVTKADETVRSVAKALRFTETEADGILDHFVSGGSLTAGGVMQAVSSYAATVDDADRSAEIEAAAVDALTAV